MTRLWTRLISWLLWLANAHPPFGAREEFYGLKDRLLKRYGHRLHGDDIQHIVKHCWTCEGTGDVDEYKECRKCGGNGIYHEFWVQLERWKIGDRVFHRPADQTSNPVVRDWWIKNSGYIHEYIEGIIRHKNSGQLATEAALWLALLYNRRLFWRILSTSHYMRPDGLLLVLVQRAMCPLATWVRRFKRRQRCQECGRWFGAIFSARYQGACARCSPRPGLLDEWFPPQKAVVEEDDGIPF